VTSRVGEKEENAGWLTLIVIIPIRRREQLKMAQQLFQLVGASASECDTIPGRQCMASCFYLLRNFEDVNVYLNSIKAYLSHDDDFNWNYGLALAATGDYKAAEVPACLPACVHACLRAWGLPEGAVVFGRGRG